MFLCEVSKGSNPFSEAPFISFLLSGMDVVVRKEVIIMLKIANLSNFKFIGLFFLFVGIISIVGCATPGRSTFRSDRPIGSTFKNEKIVNRPFNEVWDDLVSNLAKSFFVINNIEKESRIINVSFYSETPEKFVDCGKTHRYYSRGNENQEYVYDIAASSSYKSASAAGPNKNLPMTIFANRRTSLDGRINIYVAPKGTGTQVTANARYILTLNLTGTYVVENVYGNPIERGNMPPSSATCSFNTNQSNTCVAGSDQKQTFSITCQSKGILETEILNFVK